MRCASEVTMTNLSPSMWYPMHATCPDSCDDRYHRVLVTVTTFRSVVVLFSMCTLVLSLISTPLNIHLMVGAGTPLTLQVYRARVFGATICSCRCCKMVMGSVHV